MSVERFENIMNNLSELPKVQEHMNKLHVRLAKEIYSRRLEKGLTQTKVVELIRKNGGKVTQAQLSRIETANENINISTYQEVLDVLDFDNIDISFRNPTRIRKTYRRRPTNKHMKIVHAEKELLKM